jgi:hypothetical protein
MFYVCYLQAEMRGAVVDAVDAILRQLPTPQRCHFAGFITRFSRSARVNHRIFAVDLVVELLKGAWIWKLSESEHDNDHEGDTSPALKVPTPAKLLKVILARASDKAPTVRARSLGAIAALTGAVSTQEDGIADQLVHSLLHQSSVITNEEDIQVDVPVLLRRRLFDERAIVRRSAIQAVVSYIILNLSTRDSATSTETNDENSALCWRDEIESLVSLCGDVSVATRKAAAAGLASIRSVLPRSSTLRKAFVGAILPMAHDAEQSVQTRCGDLIKEAILEPVAVWGKMVFESEHCAMIQNWTSSIVDPTGVWYLLLAASSSDSQQCLQSVFWPLHLRAPNVSVTSASNFVGGPSLLSNLLRVLRQSALVGSGLQCSDENAPWNGEQLDDDYELKRVLRMTIRQGSWILLEGLLSPTIQVVSHQPAVTSNSMVEASFVVSCWRSLWTEIETTQNVMVNFLLYEEIMLSFFPHFVMFFSLCTCVSIRIMKLMANGYCECSHTWRLRFQLKKHPLWLQNY